MVDDDAKREPLDDDRELPDGHPTPPSVGECEHMRASEPRSVPDEPVCAECVAVGSTWFHLRMCLACGQTGCCDQSPLKHATAHFHQTAHPVIRSAQPGEDWRWCFVDEIVAPTGGGP